MLKNEHPSMKFKQHYNYPKISIITPNFNYGHFLEETILSVISQGYPNLEYIIVDGGSTDNSIEIIKKYATHLTYWVSEPDAGVYDAINKGFKKATGDIMGYLNSDDLYLPWCLHTVADVFSTLPRVLWLSTLQPGYIDYRSESRWFGSLPGFSQQCFLDGHYAGLYSKYRYIQQESTFWKKELWKMAGSNICLDYELAGDFYLWNEFYKSTELFGILNPFGLFRINELQKSMDIEKYVLECGSILKKEKPDSFWNAGAVSQGFKNYVKPLTNSLSTRNQHYSGEVIIRDNINNNASCWKIEQSNFVFNQ